MSGKEYTDDELSGLSQTERDALTATDEDNDDILNDIAGEDDDGEGDDQDDDGKDDKAADDQAAADAAANDVKDAGDDKGTVEIDVPGASVEFDLADVPPVTFVPKLSGELLPAYEQLVKDIEAKEEEGEISSSEARREIRKLEAQSQNDDLARQLWVAEQETFLRLNKEYDPKSAPAEYDKLNKEVVRLANSPEAADLTGIQILYVAKNNLAEAIEFAEFKRMKAEQKAGKAPEADKGKTVPAKPSSTRPNLQTLRDVPAADVSEVGQDKFAHLDKLSGMALESAIARLNPAEKEAYLAGA